MRTSVPGKCSPASSGSSRRRRCGAPRSASCSRTPRLELRASRYAATGCSSRLGRAGRACASAPSSRTWNATWRCWIVRESLADYLDFARRFEVGRPGRRGARAPAHRPGVRLRREPGRAYVVSRYLRGGESCRSRGSRRAARRPGRQRVVEQVASALAFAHRQGMVHGRVRPVQRVPGRRRQRLPGGLPGRLAAPADPAVDRRHLADLARRLLGDAAPGNLAGDDVPPVEAGVVWPGPQSLQGAATVRRGRRP